MKNLPTELPIFPLSNFIIFPKTTVPLNIFEPRYIDMVNDSMKFDKLIGMIQPKNSVNKDNNPELHEVGCVGKITSFSETEDGRFLIELKGLTRFKNIREIKTEKKYRILEVSYESFYQDLINKKEEIKFSDLELIFKDLKSLFEKRGFIINWKALEKQSLDETINALAMASPFTLEEKQILLEAEMLDLLAVPEEADVPMDQFSFFLHLLFEAVARYRFLYQDLVNVLSRYDQLQVRFRRVLKKKELAFNTLCESFRRQGIMNIGSDELASVCEQLTLTVCYWSSFDTLSHLDDRESVDPGRGVYQMLHLLLPYLNEEEQEQVRLTSRTYL